VEEMYFIYKLSNQLYDKFHPWARKVILLSGNMIGASYYKDGDVGL
jgi:hypothetical protein